MSANTTLREFFAEHFRPEILAGLKHDKKYLNAVTRFGRMLGHEPMISDLTESNHSRFREYIRVEHGRAQIHSVYRLRRMWKHAIKCGLTDQRPTLRKKETRAATDALIIAKPRPLARKDCKTLFDFVVCFYVPLKLGGGSEGNLRLYGNTLRWFDKFLEREALLTDLTDETLARFLAWRLASGVAPPTANMAINQLCAFGRFAFKKSMLKEWPTVTHAREPGREPMAWTNDELGKLWAAIDALPGKVAGIPSRLWWRALHEIAWWSGERISAILSLRWAEVDLADGWVLFLAENRKGKTRDNRARLAPSAIEALRAIEQPDREFVLPWTFHKSYLWYRYTRILKAAGLPTDRKSKFHRMRKSVASHYAAAGGDATRLLDHSSPRVTKAYLDRRIATVAQPADVLFVPGENS